MPQIVVVVVAVTAAKQHPYKLTEIQVQLQNWRFMLLSLTFSVLLLCIIREIDKETFFFRFGWKIAKKTQREQWSSANSASNAT